MKTNNPIVLIIIGSAHGGSTISNMVIGQHPEVFSVGTMQGFPDNGQLDEDNYCSCGVRAAECKFWRKVLQEVQDVPSGKEKESALFRSIHYHGGRKVVVDVAHGASRLTQLIDVPGIDLKVLYTLRPRRGVVFSNIRKGWERDEFARPWRDPIESALRIGRGWWLNQRMAEEFCRTRSVQFETMSYDELCRGPQSALDKPGQLLGLDYSGIGDQVAQGQPLTPPPHLIRGNRNLRFKTDIRLRRDEGYLQYKAPIQRVFAGLGTMGARMEYLVLGGRRLRRMIEKAKQ